MTLVGPTYQLPAYYSPQLISSACTKGDLTKYARAGSSASSYCAASHGGGTAEDEVRGARHVDVVVGLAPLDDERAAGQVDAARAVDAALQHACGE